MGPAANLADKAGAQTPLIGAAKAHGHLEVVFALLAHGARMDGALASAAGIHPPVAWLLLERGGGSERVE